ncbi:transmembrane protein [Cyclospora cayetanensis]|uniref:Transmembrane protein n=1 Tax=Cyclospora cayetanensis TaxID=88456 RepID=A0A1D3CVD6_9EIME|nr:transmembrane protein [Cyclospora cayetanensis]
MTVATCILQFLVLFVSLVVPTVVSVHLLSTKGRDAAGAAAARRLLEYFLVLCCLQQLLQCFPVSTVLHLLPAGLALLLKLAAASALAIPALSLPPQIVSFALAHYDEYLTAAVTAAEQKILLPLKANVTKAIEAGRQRVQ